MEVLFVEARRRALVSEDLRFVGYSTPSHHFPRSTIDFISHPCLLDLRGARAACCVSASVRASVAGEPADRSAHHLRGDDYQSTHAMQIFHI